MKTELGVGPSELRNTGRVREAGQSAAGAWPCWDESVESSG